MQRRRFIKILASSAAGLSLGQLGAANASTALQAVRWRGYTLGAEGSFTLYTEDRTSAQTVLQHCFAEIRRLESLFSLYQPNSELCQLNRTGRLDAPASEWLTLLDATEQAYALSNGHFDPTVQPFWQAYAQHFEQHPNATEGPSEAALATALVRTGWQHVSYDAGTIQFDQPNMQLTLNGIAQGFITDHISSILKNAGYQHVLVELGETRAIGPHPEQRPWSIGIKDAHNPDQIRDIAELDNQALATSGSYGSPFSTDGTFHHLIHPKSGKPSTRWKSLSVIAPSATQADALSTGLSFASATEIETIERAHSQLRIIKQS